MEEIKFFAEVREGKRKGVARKLRSKGLIPGILYGGGEEVLLIQLGKKETEKKIRGLEAHNVMADLIVKIDGEEKTYKTILKEIQVDPIRGEVIHLDFCRIRMDKPVVMEVPLHLVGESIGVEKGGILEHELRELMVEALPKDIPEAIEVDISNLDIGDALLVKDIRIPENIRIVEDEEKVVVSIIAPKVSAEEEKVEEEEEAEPEVISEEKAEERRKEKEEGEEKTE